MHATLTYSNGNFYVKDEDAKFGTLLYLREPVILPMNRSLELNLQIGRFAINIVPHRDRKMHSDAGSELED